MPTNTRDIDWSKRQEVTDPAILDQLNSGATSSNKPIADKVDEALSNNGLPIDKRELVLAQLRHETGKPNLDSHVAITNNNVSGITWSDSFPKEWKGTARPDSEGGNYVHFPTYDDWAKEHIKLLKNDSGAGAPLDANTIEQYAHRLKKNGYYTAAESEYVKGMKGMSDQYGREPEEVTDPAILAQLNGTTQPDPQKKSPSDTVLGNNSQSGPQDSSQIEGVTPVDPDTHLPVLGTTQTAQIQPGPLPQTQSPTVNAAPQDHPNEEVAKTAGYASTIAQDVLQNAPQSYGQNLASTAMTDHGNIVHDLTNPHADPTNTAQWGQHRVATLEQQRKEELAQAKQLELEGAPLSEGKTTQQVNADYDTKVKTIKDAVDHTVALQQFNKEYTQKKYTPEEAQEQIQALATESHGNLQAIQSELAATQKAIKDAGAGITLKIPQDEYSALLQKNKDLQIQQNTLQNQYNQQAQKIQNDTKYNPIQLGAEHAALNGDKQAQADLASLNAGKPINPDHQQAYNVKGNDILKTGVANLADEDIKKQVGQYVDTSGDQLFQNNKGYYINQLANARYKDENPLSSLILPTSPWTKDEVKQYGKQIGLSDNAIKELQKDPGQIPKSAAEAQLFARGALNSYAPIKEAGARVLGKLGGVPSEMVNADYPAGWQNQRGPGAWVAGATPSDQNSFHNVRGAIGQVVEGVGGLAGLTGEVGAATKVFEEAGIGAEAASKLANMGVMSFNGYNEAYHNSLDVIGDKPEDEAKRQAYSMVNGLLTGAIFSIDPKANLLTKAFKVSDKVEAPLLEQIEKNNGVSFLTTPEGKNTLTNYIVHAAKENGTQVGLGVAQKVAEDITNTIANPKQKQDIPEDIKNTAISTSLAMLVPSLIGASGREKSQTPYNAAAVWEMGTNPDVYTKHIDNLKDAGKITPEQASASQQAIATMKNIVSNIPTTNDNGEDLSPNQVKDYAFKMLQEHTLQQQVDQITQQATATGTKPDKVQIDNLNKKIADLQKQRQKAYDNPVVPTMRDQYVASLPIRLKELNQAPADERSVATDAQSAVDAYVTKIKQEGKENGLQDDYKRHISEIKEDPKAALTKELTFYQTSLEREKAKEEPNQEEISKLQSHIDEVQPLLKKITKELGNTKKEDIPLTPQESSQTKTNDHERHENGERARQDGTQEGQSKDQRADTEVRDDQEDGRIQGQEESIKPTTVDSEAGASEQPTPAISVGKKKRRKLVADEEPIPVKEEPNLQTQDLGEVKGQSEEKTAEKVKEATIEHPDAPADVMVAEHPEGESFNEAKDRFKGAIDKIAKDAPDNTVVMTHSWGLKLLEAAEKKGWDHPDLGAEHQKQSTETGDLIPYKTEDGRTIWFARHGETEDNVNGKQRTNDTPLTEKGRQQAKDIATKLKEQGIKPSQIITSDLPRAKETSDIISKEFAEPLKSEADASTQTKEQQQKSIQPGGEQEHARTEQAGGKDATAETENSNSPIRSAKKAVKKETEFQRRKREAADGEPQSFKEAALRLIVSGERINQEDIKHDLGISGADLKPYLRRLSSKGTRVDDFIEQYHNPGEEHRGALHLVDDTQDARREFMDIWQQYGHDENTALDELERIQGKDYGKWEEERYQAHTVGESLSDAREHEINTFIDAGEFEPHQKATEQIHDAELTDKDDEAITEYLSNHLNYDGKMNGETALDPSNKDFKELYENLSPAGKELFDSLLAEKDTGGWAELTPKQKVDFSKLQNQANESKKTSKIGTEPSKESAVEGVIASGDEQQNDETSGQEKKLKETPNPNGAIATADVETTKGDATNLRLKQIEDNLRQQRASQQLEGKKREAAERAKDIPTANKHNENWYKKQDKIDRLEEEKESILKQKEKEEREASIKKTYNDFADKLEKKYEANKKKNEGVALSSILGISTKIGDHVADFVVARAIEGIRELGNIHIAVDRAIRLAKEKFGSEAKDLDNKDNDAIKEHLLGLGQKNPQIKDEPVLPIDHEEYAKDLLADIKSGDITHEQAIKEVRDEVIENREGNPLSDHVQETNKAKILKYIDYHIQNDLTSIKNTTTRLRREQFGLNEEIPAAEKEFGETWEEAKQKIEDNPQTPQNLIAELSQKARPLSDVENAIMLHQQNTKEVEYQDLNNKINKTAEAGDQASLVEYKTSKARVLDELQQIYDINKAVGTENARGLASRRMMVDRKYSLVNMIAEKRATANEGQPLSEEQEKQIEDLHQKIQETQTAFDDYIKHSESQIIDLQRKALEGKLKDKKGAANKLREWADKIEKASKNQAYSSPIPITPKMVADGIRLVADGIDKGAQIVDAVKQAIGQLKKDTPDIDDQQLEKEINKSLIESGILEPSTERRKAEDMGSLFTNGKLDREALRLKTDADRAKAQHDINLKRDKERELSKLAKAQNLFIKWQRAFKLSNPLTMAKLMSAGITRLVTTPLEDIVGGAYSTILPQLAKGAIGEGGGLNINETAKAYKIGIIRGMKDSQEIMSKKSQGKSELDVLFGKAGELPPESIDFFGQLHSATKAPIKRAIFERSLERRLRRNLANGADISDPMVQTSIMMDAYKDANRAIFMQDNKVAEGWQKLIRHFDQVDPKTGKANSKIIGTALQWLAPFVKVPTNIAAETGTHVYGVPVAAAKLVHAAFTKGIENIPDDQKEIILRNLKKGSLGLAAVALGYFNPDSFGGYYQPGQKRKEDDAEAMGAKIGDQKIPALFIEAPIFQAMQIGATIRRVKEAKVHGEEQGIGEGLWAGVAGLAQSVPLASQPVRVAQLFGTPKNRDYYLGELAKSTIDPALLTYLAKVTDPADEGSPIRKALAPENKRKTPKTLAEHIKSGLPFLREDLEEK